MVRSDTVEFRPLKGGPPRRLPGEVGPVRVERQTPVALLVQTGENSFLEIASPFAIALERYTAVEEKSAVKLKLAPGVDEFAPSEDGVAVIRVIENNSLVCEVRVRACHDLKSPVVVRTNTVAETGEAASFPGGLE